MSNLMPIQRSLSFNPTIQNNKNLSLINTSSLKTHKSLSKLGRKKTVSFSTNVSIINVECWKSYNMDVSESGGCFAWDINKKTEKEKEKENKKKEKEDGCVCMIF